MSLQPVSLRSEQPFAPDCSLYSCDPFVDHIEDPEAGVVFRCHRAGPIVWCGRAAPASASLGLQGWKRIFPGASQPRRPIERLHDSICSSCVQHTAPNSTFFNAELHCVVSRRRFGFYKIRPPLPYVLPFATCNCQQLRDTQGACLLTSTPLPLSASSRVIGTRAAVIYPWTADTRF